MKVLGVDEVEVDVDVEVEVDVLVEVDVHVMVAVVVAVVVVEVVVDVLVGVNGKRLWSGRLGESAVLGGWVDVFDVLGRLAAG